jgi:hypothetical protein
MKQINDDRLILKLAAEEGMERQLKKLLRQKDGDGVVFSSDARRCYVIYSYHQHPDDHGLILYQAEAHDDYAAMCRKVLNHHFPDPTVQLK